MTTEWAMALIGFAFAMSISPGPGNFLLLASGANFGFTRTLPLLFGISIGFLVMVLLVGVALGPLLERHPALFSALRLSCGAYVLWLAVRIATSPTVHPGGAPKTSQPVSFAQGAMLQALNPKAWTVALIVTVTYTLPEMFGESLAAVIAIFAAINLPAIGAWALAGQTLRRFLATGRRMAVFNVAMAMLLVGSMAPLLLPVR